LARFSDDGETLTFSLKYHVPKRMMHGVPTAPGRTAAASYPEGLWPLQCSLAVGLRLRMLGWMVRLVWPDRIHLRKREVGSTRVTSTSELLEVEVEVLLRWDEREVPSCSITGEAYSYGALPDVNGEGVLLSCAQSLLAVLESPWSPPRMLEWYGDWSDSLGKRTPVPTPDGTELAGIAFGITRAGALTVELRGGRCVDLPPKVTKA
jgi:hypothetical protein